MIIHMFVHMFVFLHVEILFVFSCLYTHFLNDIHIHMSKTKNHNIYST